MHEWITFSMIMHPLSLSRTCRLCWISHWYSFLLWDVHIPYGVALSCAAHGKSPCWRALTPRDFDFLLKDIGSYSNPDSLVFPFFFLQNPNLFKSCNQKRSKNYCSSSWYVHHRHWLTWLQPLDGWICLTLTGYFEHECRLLLFCVFLLLRACNGSQIRNEPVL